MMTPEEFANKMMECDEKFGKDYEAKHEEMDELMCNLLEELGYGEGVKVFVNADLYYA